MSLLAAICCFLCWISIIEILESKNDGAETFSLFYYIIAWLVLHGVFSDTYPHLRDFWTELTLIGALCSIPFCFIALGNYLIHKEQPLSSKTEPVNITEILGVVMGTSIGLIVFLGYPTWVILNIFCLCRWIYMSKPVLTGLWMFSTRSGLIFVLPVAALYWIIPAIRKLSAGQIAVYSILFCLCLSTVLVTLNWAAAALPK